MRGGSRALTAPKSGFRYARAAPYVGGLTVLVGALF
jgi:hypothetical protein